MNLNEKKEIRLTNEPGLDDGPEYSHDGRYIYYNSMASGKMEIWRMDFDGKNKIPLTQDKYSNWFPHTSPDGKYPPPLISKHAIPPVSVLIEQSIRSLVASKTVNPVICN